MSRPDKRPIKSPLPTRLEVFACWHKLIGAKSLSKPAKWNICCDVTPQGFTLVGISTHGIAVGRQLRRSHVTRDRRRAKSRKKHSHWPRRAGARKKSTTSVTTSSVLVEGFWSRESTVDCHFRAEAHACCVNTQPASTLVPSPQSQRLYSV